MLLILPKSTLRFLAEPGTASSTQQVWQDRVMTTWQFAQEPANSPFPVDFESTLDLWQTWPRMFVEPDGSFVWVSQPGTEPWQLDGNLYDRHGRLWTVDLQGSISLAAWEQFLTALQLPATQAFIQFQAAGYFVTAATLSQVFAIT